LEKKYTQKEYLKIAVIVVIIVVPLVVAYGAAGYFDPTNSKFWSNWNCDQLIEFSITSEFRKITLEQNRLYNLDMTPCLEE
jgi:hypothetical protein